MAECRRSHARTAVDGGRRDACERIGAGRRSTEAAGSSVRPRGSSQRRARGRGLVPIPAVGHVREVAAAPVATRLDVVTPPTSDAVAFALSHDGRQLAFVANGEKGPQLWLRPLDQVKAQPLAGTEGASIRSGRPMAARSVFLRTAN